MSQQLFEDKPQTVTLVKERIFAREKHLPERLRFLQKYIQYVYDRIEGYCYQESGPRYHVKVLDFEEIFDEILRLRREFLAITHKKPRYLLVGHEYFDRVGADINTAIQVNGTLRVAGLTVIFHPWATGMVVLPPFEDLTGD